LHCLDMFRQSVGKHTWTTHTVQCLSYLRQGALCAADLHLEPIEGEDGDYGDGIGEMGERLGKSDGLHRCRDWTEVYEEEARLHEIYTRWHRSHNTTTMVVSS